MKEERIKIGDLNISYKTVGEGDPILILHGWGSKSNRWQTVAKLLAGRNFSVIIPDLPGFGESDPPKLTWGFSDYSNFINEFSKKLELEDFYLLGHSFGGNIAITYSVHHQNRVRKLFLVGAAAIRSTTIKKKTIYTASKTFKFLSFIKPLKKLLYKLIKSDYPNTQGIMKDIYLNIIKIDLRDILEEIKVETLIIWGEKDNITPVANARFLNSKIENSKLEIIPQLGHNLHSEAPGMLSNIIVDSLR